MGDRRHRWLPLGLLLVLVVVAGLWTATRAVAVPAVPRPEPAPEPPRPGPVVAPASRPVPEERGPGTLRFVEVDDEGPWIWSAPPPADDGSLAAPDADAILSVVESSLPSQLHPLHAVAPRDLRYVDLVYDRLFRAEADGGFGSDLVAEAEIDGTRVTVRLRPDVRFHDGHPVAARDVCATVRILIDPTVRSEVAGRWRERLRACDEHADGRATVWVRGASELYGLDAREALDFPLLPARLSRADLLPSPSPPPGTGPLRIEWREPDLVLGAFENPHRRATVRRVLVRAGPLADAMRGTADVAIDLSWSDVASVAPMAGVTLVPASTRDALVLVLDTTDPPWSDGTLRLALDLALDRTALATAAGRSGYTRPGWPGMGIRPRRPDPVAARVLAGRRFVLGTPAAERPVADALSAQLRGAGVDVELREVPEGATPAGVDGWLTTWCCAGDPLSFEAVLGRGAKGNVFHHDDPVLDELFASRRGASDRVRIADRDGPIVARVVETDPVLFLWAEDAPVAIADRVRVPAALRLETLFSPIEEWRVLP